MAINISDKHKCIFVHIPRAAGTSIKKALELEGRGHLPWQYYYLVYREQWVSYHKFTVVRNPWDRVVSAYNYAKMDKSYWHDNINRIAPHPDYELLHNKTFEECCEILRSSRTLLKHEAWQPQYLWVVNEEDENKILMVDYVLRFENLQNDFLTLCERLRITNVGLSHANPSNHDQYRRYYNQETKSIIENLYSEDIELLNYTF